MGLFERFPYTNFHDLNLTWILNELKTLEHTINEFVSINALKYADPIQWNITTQYEKNTIVIDPLTGTAYISVQPVPSGVALTNTDYWTVVFDLGSFVVKAAQNFCSRYEEATTLTATFPSSVNDWLIWGDTLYYALVNITAGDTYVPDSNIKQFTVEDVVGHLQDLNTTDKSNLVAAINELVQALIDEATRIDAMTGDLADLNTTDKSNLVAAINEVLLTIFDTTGDLADLNTTDKSNLVNAINEVLTKVSALPKIFVEAYGAVGDGVTDDTAAIQQCIDENPNCQIIFSGKYLITSTITVPTAYGTVLNLTGSELKAGAAITMVEFSRTYNPLSYSSVTQFYGITGGVIDGAGVATIGVKNHDNRGIYTNLKIIDFTQVGFYDNYNDDPDAGQTFISNMSVMMQRYTVDWSEGSAVGLVLNGQDCRITNLAVMRCNIAIRVLKTGTLYNNIYLYGQLNETKYPALTFGDYVCKGFQLEQTIVTLKLPHLAANVYFDTLHYGVYNAGDTGHNFICNNVQMYSDNVGFNNIARELYLVGGKPMSCTFKNINCYDNDYSIFVKGQYDTVSLVEDNYSKFEVSHNPNYLAYRAYSLNNLGAGRRYVRANMTQYLNYKIGELATSSSSGIGSWKIKVRVAGVEDLEAIISNYGGGNGLTVAQINNRISNTTVMFRVSTTLQSRTLQNGKTYYYYNLYVTTLNASENMWLESDIEALTPQADGYMYTYYDPLPAETDLSTIDVPIDSGVRTFSIADGTLLKKMVSDPDIVSAVKSALKVVHFENLSFTIAANSSAIVNFTTATDLTDATVIGMLTQFIPAAGSGLTIDYCQYSSGTVYCGITNTTAASITSSGDIYYTYI